MDKDTRHTVIVGSCLVSIVASIILFAKGDKELGIFVGLWAPTIAALNQVWADTMPSTT